MKKINWKAGFLKKHQNTENFRKFNLKINVTSRKQINMQWNI